MIKVTSNDKELTFNTAASKIILQKYFFPRSSQIPADAPSKMLANKQFELKSNGKVYGHIIFHIKLVRMEYAQFNSFIVEDNPSPIDITYNVNLTNTIEGTNLALCDGGANGCIKWNDMRLVSYKKHGRRVNIDITGDH